MTIDHWKARDHQVLDAVDAISPELFEGRVWRAVREGRDPTLGSPSLSRWCNAQFDVLYTSLQRDGAIAEINSLLSLQPVFPSKMRWDCYELKVRSERTLRIADLPTLQKLGVDVANYHERRYERTQIIADAACFLGFDGLIAPSARWNCNNLVLFTARLRPSDIELTADTGTQINWTVWRRDQQGR